MRRCTESVALRFGSKDSNNNGTIIAPTSRHDPVKHWTRVCQIVWDYDDPEMVCACVEIDDAGVGGDGGRSFRRSDDGIALGDVRGMAIVRNGARTLYATTAFGLHASTDDGATWRLQHINSPWQYTRSIVERADRTGTMFLTNGSGAPGWHGRLYRSRDRGTSWKAVPLRARWKVAYSWRLTRPTRRCCSRRQPLASFIVRLTEERHGSGYRADLAKLVRSHGCRRLRDARFGFSGSDSARGFGAGRPAPKRPNHFQASLFTSSWVLAPVA